LIPQALTGQPLQAPPPQEVLEENCGRLGRRRELTLETSFKNIFLGIAFLIIAIALSRTIGAGWWFWMLIPAFLMLGNGIGQYIRVKNRDERMLAAPQRVGAVMPRHDQPAFPRASDELRSPVASVTEGTTRHLGVEAPTRHLEPQERK
jgi:hypothetical protein